MLCCVALAGCDALTAAGFSRQRVVDASIRKCGETSFARKQGGDCTCLMTEVSSSLSDAELRLLVSDDHLFDEEELETFVLRNAIKCARPSFISNCVRGGGSQGACSCIAEELFANFKGAEIEDISERSQNGAPLPPAFVQLRSDCVRKFAPPVVPGLQPGRPR